MAGGGSPAPRRPLVVFVLPVWGEPYVTQFLDLNLRTLLAPGNIPAVAEACDCTFRILTTSDQEPYYHGHPMFQLLSRYCAVEFTAIDDLVFPGVHSATITLAYIRGMRESGAAMTGTYFVFLVADFIVADGSFRHLVRHIRAGVNGVTMGNFQIVKEDAEPVIRALVRDASAPLSVAPRALLGIALEHLHPVVLASMPAAGSHTMICNRVYWRAGAGTLIARFYLRHMLCIRPETDRFDIGSSCDYSFIPEMCPSGRVVAIADSDDCCIVEMQPLGHEKKYILPGRLTPRRLAGYLSDWTTADHRQNAHTAVVFHAGDISRDVAGIVADSEGYIRRVETWLPAAPQPHRGHPYWHAALRAAAEGTERQRRFGARAPFTRSHPDDLAAGGERPVVRIMRARRIYERCVRQGLFPFPWHPSWLDSRREARVVLTAMGEASGLVVAEEATAGSDWAARRTGDGWRFMTPAMLAAGAVSGGPFAVCLLYLNCLELSSLPDMLRRIRPHLATHARTVVVFGGEWQSDPRVAIARDVAGYRIERIDVVSSLAMSPVGVAWSRVLMRASMTVSPGRWAWAAIRLSGLAAAALVSNLIRLIVPGVAGPPTRVLVTLCDHTAHAPAIEDGRHARA
jgi:hypothetical protein